MTKRKNPFRFFQKYPVNGYPSRSLGTPFGRRLLVTSTLLFIIFSFRPAYSEDGFNVRVCVEGDKNKIILTVKGPYLIKTINTDSVLSKGNYLGKEIVSPTNSGIKLGDSEFKIYGIRIIPKNDATIYVDNMHFRGIVDIMRTKELKLLVVNHLDVEKYLYGVLYHEMPHYWPIEAIKAQAVAARTFALYRMENSKDRDYDVTSDIYSQVYGGRKSERWITRKAVDATKGKVLTYQGRILPAYYHSMCAGHTEDAKKVFNIDLAPLKGKPCPYCEGAPHARWKAMFSYKQIEESLNKYGIKVKGLNFIAEGKRDASGRLEEIKIRDKKGVRRIKGFEFRLALGPNVIKSANFTIEITPKGVIFRGKGWGHGVGMCQWGAFGMSKRRFNYREILEFYYPEAKIEDYAKIIRF